MQNETNIGPANILHHKLICRAICFLPKKSTHCYRSAFDSINALMLEYENQAEYAVDEGNFEIENNLGNNRI